MTACVHPPTVLTGVQLRHSAASSSLPVLCILPAPHLERVPYTGDNGLHTKYGVTVSVEYGVLRQSHQTQLDVSVTVPMYDTHMQQGEGRESGGEREKDRRVDGCG